MSFDPRKLGSVGCGMAFAGGWKYGSPLQFYRESAHLAEKGVLAVSFDYRISYLYHSSQENALEDARDAIEWLRSRSEDFGVSPAKICCGGASAGACMAALLASQDPNGKIACRYPTCCCWNIRHWQTSYLCSQQDASHVVVYGNKDEFTK